jgi:gamma-glutamyltranspeptidase/glutathione hydrolase
LAKRGFPLGPHLDGALDRTQYETIQAEFPDEHRPGTWIERKTLGRTIARWARSGGDSLYTGADGEALVEHVQEQGGILTVADLSDYAVQERDPVVVQFRDYTIVSMAPPSSGGVVLAQVLQVLADDDLQALGLNSSAYIHRVTEALKHAYADRARDLGDPDFVEVPVADLISQARVEAVRRAFNADQTLPNEAYGRGAQLPDDHGTQHISVIDADGGACALTTTVNTSFGSGVVVPGLGLILNNEMDDFASQPGVPNAYGLVGGVENGIEPGKRPLSSTTPTLVLDADGNVVMSVGASGGSTIISSVIQVILNVTVFDLDPQEAVASARFHHQWKPDILFLEPEIARDVQDGLTARGHTVNVRSGFSAVQAVTSDQGTQSGGADPRKGGWPAGVWMSDD